MNTKLYKLVTTTLLTSLLVAGLALPVFAQSGSTDNQGSDQNQNQGQNDCSVFANSAGPNQPGTLGSGPDTAFAPTNCSVGIGPDQTHWYRFRYGRPLDDDEDEEGPVSIQPTDAIVTLKMNNPGCISFEIQTPGRLLAQQNPDADDDVRDNPIGAGSPIFIINSDGDNDTDPGTLLWRGGSSVSETFYVVVKNDRDAVCTYRLSVTGPTVSFGSNPVVSVNAADSNSTMGSNDDSSMSDDSSNDDSSNDDSSNDDSSNDDSSNDDSSNDDSSNDDMNDDNSNSNG